LYSGIFRTGSVRLVCGDFDRIDTGIIFVSTVAVRLRWIERNEESIDLVFRGVNGCHEPLDPDPAHETKR